MQHPVLESHLWAASKCLSLDFSEIRPDDVKRPLQDNKTGNDTETPPSDEMLQLSLVGGYGWQGRLCYISLFAEIGAAPRINRSPL